MGQLCTEIPIFLKIKLVVLSPGQWPWHQNFLTQENYFFILIVMQEVYLVIVLSANYLEYESAQIGFSGLLVVTSSRVWQGRIAHTCFRAIGSTNVWTKLFHSWIEQRNQICELFLTQKESFVKYIFEKLWIP